MAALSAPADDQYTWFLFDGLRPAPTPVLLVVADTSAAWAAVAAAYRGELPLDFAPATGHLLQLAAHEYPGTTEEDAEAFASELVAGKHWIYVTNIDQLLDAGGGQKLLAVIVEQVAAGALAAVVGSVSKDGYSRLSSHCLRLVAFATTLELSNSARGWVASELDTVVQESLDRSDTGWTVMVRLQLSSAVSSDKHFEGEVAAQSAAYLVERMFTIGDPPEGVLVSLRADAFTVSQREAAFNAARQVANGVVGRTLAAGEGLTAVRGIYHG